MFRADRLILAVMVLLAAGVMVLMGRRARRLRQLEGALTGDVGEIMSRPPVVTHLTATIAEAAEIMVRRGIGALPVVDTQGALVGIITESNLTAARETDRPVDQVMDGNVITATEDERVADVAARMIRFDLRHLPVVRGRTPVGVIARHDLLRLLVIGGGGSDPATGAGAPRRPQVTRAAA